MSFDYTNQTHIIYLILALLILGLLFSLLRYKARDYISKRRARKRFERGNKLEVNAKNYLENRGYEVVDYQSTYDHCYRVDGVEQVATIQPDYIVKKNGKRYIVEVKSGTSAISVRNRHTRRQILEYDYVIKNDGVFLLDMENEELQLIEFETKAEKKSKVLLKTIIVIALIGVFVPYLPLKICIAIVMLIIFLSHHLK